MKPARPARFPPLAPLNVRLDDSGTTVPNWEAMPVSQKVVLEETDNDSTCVHVVCEILDQLPSLSCIGHEYVGAC